MTSKIDEFFKELQMLQSKYEIYIHPDSEDIIDYDWDESPYVTGSNPYITLVDKNDKVLATIDWENELIKEEEY